MARTGRRPGQTQTREDILAAARTQFAGHGYAGATIRGIAAEAGVNPALVHHFFGSKDKVFVSALQLPFDPTVLVDTILDGPQDEIGERVMRLFFGLWRDPDRRDGFLALLRSVSGSPEIAGLLREFLERVVIDRLAPALGVPKVRIAAMASQAIGIGMVRYVVGVEPLTGADDEELIALIAPVFQYYVGERRPD